MIRVECVGLQDGDPYRFARRPLPDSEADEDVVLLCPQHELDNEEAQLVYDEFGADHTEWISQHFPYAAQNMATEGTLGFLFLETFGEYVMEYEVALELEGEGDDLEASLEVTDRRWTLIEEGVTIPYHYKVCENLVSGVWFNYVIDEFDLDREPFEISAIE